MNLRALRSSFATRPDEDLAIFDKPEKLIQKIKKIKVLLKINQTSEMFSKIQKNE